VLRQQPALLVIVGDGPERTALTDHAAKLGIQNSIVFTGMCAHPERLLPYFTAFGISSDTEQMPLSVIEAMAAARPVVATDVGDIREMVADENRPFIVGKEVAALSTALLSLLRDPRQAAQIGTANSRRARELFDQRRMLAQYKALFDARSLFPGGA
jgi:glycosyltransferase involved in cell wall biosynthesis